VTPVDLVDVYAAAQRLGVRPETLFRWAKADGWTRYGREQRRTLFSWRVIKRSAQTRQKAAA
jgi:hypothetical protein